MRRLPALALGFVLAVGGASAAERAGFISGTFTTGDGCAKLKALAKGTPRNVSTVPEVLNSKGFEGWEESCEFTHIHTHKPGEVWIGLMFCVEGPKHFGKIYSFVRNPADGSLEVSTETQEQPDVWKRCEVR